MLAWNLEQDIQPTGCCQFSSSQPSFSPRKIAIMVKCLGQASTKVFGSTSPALTPLPPPISFFPSDFSVNGSRNLCSDCTSYNVQVSPAYQPSPPIKRALKTQRDKGKHHVRQSLGMQCMTYRFLATIVGTPTSCLHTP